MPRNRRWVAPLVTAAVVGVFLLGTPIEVRDNAWVWLLTDRYNPWVIAYYPVISALPFALARVSVVVGVALGRHRPVLGTALTVWPFLLLPVVGVVEWGWWLGLLAVAALAAADGVRRAVVPTALALVLAGVYTFVHVDAMLPVGPVYAVKDTLAANLLSFGMHAVAVLVVVAAAAAVGAARRSARAAADAEAQASQARGEMVRAASEARDARTAEAVASERSRVARDLHDVVAHHISLVAVRAESAPYVHPDLDDDARRVLADIAQDARGALDELRQVLTVLQRAADGPALAPQPSLGDVTGLVETARAAGQDVTLDWTGPRVASSAAGYVVFRAVQEALTNARRHAPGVPVRVVVDVADDVTFRVVNALHPIDGDTDDAVASGMQPTHLTPGRGLLGMRERVEAIGGTLEVSALGGHVEVRGSVPTGSPGTGRGTSGTDGVDLAPAGGSGVRS